MRTQRASSVQQVTLGVCALTSRTNLAAWMYFLWWRDGREWQLCTESAPPGGTGGGTSLRGLPRPCSGLYNSTCTTQSRLSQLCLGRMNKYVFYKILNKYKTMKNKNTKISDTSRQLVTPLFTQLVIFCKTSYLTVQKTIDLSFQFESLLAYCQSEGSNTQIINQSFKKVLQQVKQNRLVQN